VLDLDLAPARDGEPLLDVRDLTVTFRSRGGTVTAVDRLNFQVGTGETLGVVGESGSGKSVSMMSILKLIRDPNCTVTGQAWFRGRDLIALRDKEMRALRGRSIAMIFQDPMTALTPVYTVGWHIVEQLQAHGRMPGRVARERAVQLLDEVGIPDAGRRIDDYPHQFSGGMRQRAVIAMALAHNPTLLIADEPTTALDVTTQAQILDLLRRLQREHNSSIVLITHDMGVISEIAERVLVMYAGRAAEVGPRRAVFREANHPYTWGLLGSVPRVGRTRLRRLPTIPGHPVGPESVPSGCAFATRCRHRFDRCDERPELAGAGDHLDACWLPRDDRQALRRSSEVAAAAEGDPGDVQPAAVGRAFDTEAAHPEQDEAVP
jgi:peptide/nickel transport system ATP-binding protein